LRENLKAGDCKQKKSNHFVIRQKNIPMDTLIDPAPPHGYRRVIIASEIPSNRQHKMIPHWPKKNPPAVRLHPHRHEGSDGRQIFAIHGSLFYMGSNAADVANGLVTQGDGYFDIKIV
jgi:hypothetical protein